MGLTSALYTGLSGLNSNQFRIDTIGDNIANVNTTAFKGSRAMFQTQFLQSLSLGAPPTAVQGGANPMQIGLGSVLGSVQRDCGAGSIETTGVPTDVAIEGDGFFIVRRSGQDLVYTRDGAFSLNAENRLVTADGMYVQGFGVDDGFYPLGSCTMKYNPKATERVAHYPGFQYLHPLLPQLPEGEGLVQGALEVLHESARVLCEVCGMAEFSMQPLAGAHGELAGVMIMAAYHRDRGNAKHRILIPDSAHGTNPASAAIAGYTVEPVPSNNTGVMDLKAVVLRRLE